MRAGIRFDMGWVKARGASGKNETLRMKNFGPGWQLAPFSKTKNEGLLTLPRGLPRLRLLGFFCESHGVASLFFGQSRGARAFDSGFGSRPFWGLGP